MTNHLGAALSRLDPVLSKLAEDMRAMDQKPVTDKTDAVVPEAQVQASTAPVAEAPDAGTDAQTEVAAPQAAAEAPASASSAEAAGFSAAPPAQEDNQTDPSKDPLAAQMEVDAKAAASSTEEKPAAVVPGANVTAPHSIGTGALQPSADLNNAAASTAPGVSAEENKACLMKLAEILELAKIDHAPLLRNLSLVENHQLPLPSGKAIVLKTTSNTAIAAKGLLEFQEKGHVSAADALEGALIVLNDKASYPNGVELKGDMQDRFMLMLAAQKVGLKVTNPVKDEDIAPEIKNAVTTEFVMHLMPLKDKLQAFGSQAAAPAENQTALKNAAAEPKAGSAASGQPVRDSRGRAEPVMSPG